jgi:phosphate transport system substrate-binding protein
MPRHVGVVLSVAIACAASSCGRAMGARVADADALAGKLVVTGSSTVAPVVAEIAIAFEALHPGVRIDVQSGGSGRGIADARSGAADIGMVSRDLVQEESDLTSRSIARDGVVVIIHADNPVRVLNRDQVVGIFTGAITNWAEVGGSAGPITVVHKAAGRATRQVFLDYFEIDERSAKADVVVGENEHGIKTVAGNGRAIGYVSIGTALADAEAGLPIRLLDVAGVAPDPERVADGEFPISRPLMLLTGSKSSPLALAFIEFACSDQAAPNIRAQHFTPTPH